MIRRNQGSLVAIYSDHSALQDGKAAWHQKPGSLSSAAQVTLLRKSPMGAGFLLNSRAKSKGVMMSGMPCFFARHWL